MKADTRRSIIALAFIAVFSSIAVAQERPLKSITYQLSMSRPQSHLFEVQIIVELPEQLKDKPLQFQMAKWSPGRYGVFDFAKNVQDFAATVPGGAPLPWTKTDGSRWRVMPGSARSMRVSYRVFANAPMSAATRW